MTKGAVVIEGAILLQNLTARMEKDPEEFRTSVLSSPAALVGQRRDMLCAVATPVKGV